MKIGKGYQARYFYSPEEYRAYINASRKPRGKDYSEDNPINSRHLSINRNRSIYVENSNGQSEKQSSTGLRANGSTLETFSTFGNSKNKGYYTPHVSKNDKDPRWAINQSYKPKATKAEKAGQAIKNKKVKAKRKISSGINGARKWVQQFFNR